MSSATRSVCTGPSLTARCHRENPLVALGRDLATEGLRYITKPGDFKVITYKLAGGAP